MKKLLVTTILAIGLCSVAPGQGYVVFDSSNDPGWVTIITPPVPDTNNPVNVPAQGTWTAALLWAPGTTLDQPLGNFIQLSTVSGVKANAGYISGDSHGDTVVNIPASNSNGNEPPGATSTFLVEAWMGSYANYASAVAANALRGMGDQFVNAVGDPTLTPPGIPLPLTGWNGSLILVPEPSTITLSILGAAALFLFRRRANIDDQDSVHNR